MYKIFHKNRNIIFVCIFVFMLSFIVYSYVNESKQIKKVISLVYDDSGSMSNNGQDFAYASYGLQNIIGLMNPCDKLSITKMSDNERNISFHIDNYEIRKSELEEVKSYNANGTDTNFKTVETALEYLYDMKSMHGEDRSYEYYLVVLTDGQFDNYPKDLTDYLSNVPKKFGSSEYNGIFVGIGDKIPERFEKDVLSAPNNYYVESDNNDEIVNALYVVHDIIYDRIVLQENEYKYDENNSIITFEPKDKIKKIIVFEQNQQVPVIDVSTYGVKANEKLIFAGTKNVSPKLDSYIVHASNETVELPKEKVTINFLDKVDVSKKNLRVMVEYANDDDKKLSQSSKSTNDVNDKNEKENKSEGNYRSGDNGLSNGSGIGDGTKNVNNNVQGVIGGKSSDGSNIKQDNTNSTNIDEKGIGKYGLANDDSKVKKSQTNIEPSISDSSAKTENNKKDIGQNNNSSGVKDFDMDGDSELIGLGGCSCARCSPYPNGYSVGLGGCTRCAPFSPYYKDAVINPNGSYTFNPNALGQPSFSYNPGNPNNPISPQNPNNLNTPNTSNTPYNRSWAYAIYSLILSILPALILLALLYGYLKKPRFDRKEHAFEKYEGKTQLDTGSMIKVNMFSKLVPYMAERGFGNDLAIKAAKKKDRIIILKKYLTPDMKIENQDIDLNRDLQLFEDTALTKIIDGKIYKYIYKYHPILDKNN